MDPQKSNSSNEAIRELLLADHTHFSNMLANNEQSGETRVNWFIGIVTATVGGLLALIVKYQESKQTLLDPALLFAIVVAAVCGLLAFGFITLMRMMLRNRSTDRQKRSLDQVRQMFEDYFDPQQLLLGYYPLGAPESKEEKKEDKKQRRKKRKEKEKSKKIEGITVSARSEVRRKFWLELKEWRKGTLRKLGGLAHTVAAINSLLVGSLFGLILYAVHRVKGWPALPEPNWWPLTKWAIGIAAVCLISFVLQWLWIIYREIKARYEIQKRDCTHAGGVVFNRTGGTVLYLLVRPEDHDANQDEWVLPKGKIEDGELHQQTAMREVREETGVHAQIVGELAKVEFKVNQLPVRSKFYLMEKRFEDNVKQRETRWKEFSVAYGMLTYSESKEMLELAHSRLAVGGP